MSPTSYRTALFRDMKQTVLPCLLERNYRGKYLICQGFYKEIVKKIKLIYMKKIYSLLFLIFVSIAFNYSYSQEGNISRGKVFESLSFKSKILEETVNYSIYLPFDYDTSTLSYPGVYLLHGFSDNETGWTQFGEVHLAADEAIATREIPPMIIIMPDAKRYFEDVKEDEVLPSFEITVTRTHIAKYAGAGGDFFPVHH